MKLVGVLGVIVGGAMIVGCGSTAKSARSASAPNDVFEAAQAELSNAIGTTRLSSAPVARDPNPLFLTSEEPRPSPPVRTWGAASELDSADADLAANPYTDAPDLYDPR